MNHEPTVARARQTTLLIALIAGLLLVAAWPAAAQSIGRVELVVLDETGKPVVGAKILVTSKELTRFRVNVATDKRGRAAVSFVDATKEYLVHIEADGYVTFEQYLQPRLGDTTRREIKLTPKTQAAADANGQPLPNTATYTPAQLAFNEGVELLRASSADPAQASSSLDAAVAKFEDALAKDPELTDAWSALAVAHAEREDWQAAIDAAQRHTETGAAPSASIYRVLYRAYQGLGNAGEAQKAREALAALGGGRDSAAFAHNEGVAAVRIGDDATALERFEEALRLAPDLVPAALGVAIIQLRHDRFAEAAAAAERLLTLDPENRTGLAIRWQAYRALGDTEKEKVALAALVRYDPAPVVAELLDRGRALFEAGDPKGAAAELERAAELAPDNAEVQYRLGYCYASLNDTPAAKRHLERFLQLAPDHPEAAAAREMVGYLQ